jgi:hypothetical protein
MVDAMRYAYKAIKEEDARSVEAGRLRGELAEAMSADAARVRNELVRTIGG